MNDWFNTGSSLVIGHRGASADAPENTLAAFALAIEQGADGIEFDVQLSADGVPVVIHDGNLERTTNSQGPVAARTAAQLQQVDAGQGQAVPALDDVFETFGPRLLYNVEIKNWHLLDRGAEAAIADRIQAHNLEKRVVVSSFNPWALYRIRRHLPRTVPLALIRMSGPLQHTHYLFDGQADHPHYPLVNAGYMQWARSRGYHVHVWTVDDPVEAQRLKQLGVHAIITNKPALIRAILPG